MCATRRAWVSLCSPPACCCSSPSSCCAGIAPGPHSHVTCGGCNTLLMFPQVLERRLAMPCIVICCKHCGVLQSSPGRTDLPPLPLPPCCGGNIPPSYVQQGASQIRCSRCGHLTQAPRAQGALDAAPPPLPPPLPVCPHLPAAAAELPFPLSPIPCVCTEHIHHH